MNTGRAKGVYGLLMPLGVLLLKGLTWPCALFGKGGGTGTAGSGGQRLTDQHREPLRRSVQLGWLPDSRCPEDPNCL